MHGPEFSRPLPTTTLKTTDLHITNQPVMPNPFKTRISRCLNCLGKQLSKLAYSSNRSLTSPACSLSGL